MATWNLLISLDDQSRSKLQEIYVQGKFPLEVRGQLANWIEAQKWSDLDETRHGDNERVQQLYDELISLVEERTHPQENVDLMAQMRYGMHLKAIKDMYEGNPWFLATSLAVILKQELFLINEYTQKTCETLKEASPQITDVLSFIQKLKDGAKEIEEDTRNYKNEQEEFLFNYQEVGKIESEKTHLQTNCSEAENPQRIAAMQELSVRHRQVLDGLKVQAAKLLDDRESLLVKMETYYGNIEIASNQVFEDLFAWKRQQQKSMSGGQDPPSLNDLQLLFEELADLLWKLCNFANQMKHLFDTLPFARTGTEKQRIEELIEKPQLCLTQIILQSFVVEKQPPQVLKTQTRFQASVRLLVGRQLNIHTNCPAVMTTILSEKQAKDVVDGKDPSEAGNCGDLLNSQSVMEYEQTAGKLHADFKNLSLKRIRRQDRRVQESVLEAKSALVFSADITIGGKTLPVRCMSLPVVVVVHGNQGPNSEATIVWDNMFSLPDRKPFDVPDEVHWHEMREALNARWRMTTGRALTDAHLYYLGAKLFPDCIYGSYDDRKVTWSAFNKEPLQGRNFTFWEWFHGAMEVVKKHLKEHWIAGHVEFVTRSHGQDYLIRSKPGTFLIRFSDGEIGGVTIAWVQPPTVAGGQQDILNLQPWTSKDFVILSLADRIFDLRELQYLYPDIPKHDAFEMPRSREQTHEMANNDYVTARIMARIDLSPPSAPTSPLAPNSMEASDHLFVFLGVSPQILGPHMDSQDQSFVDHASAAVGDLYQSSASFGGVTWDRDIGHSSLDELMRDVMRSDNGH